MPDVEVVLFWVDENDPDFVLQKGNFKPPSRVYHDSPARYRSWDLIKVSLASLLVNVGWVSRITLITANGAPENLADLQRLNHSVPIRIVNVRTILGAEHLPTFNTYALDTCLVNIPDLAEYVLYVNDDMIFLKPTRRQDYLNDAHQVVLGPGPEAIKWYRERTIKRILTRLQRRLMGPFDRLRYAMLGLAKDAGRDVSLRIEERSKAIFEARIHGPYMSMEHFPFVLAKRDLQRIDDEFKKEIEATRSDRFRGPNCISAICMALSLAVNEGRVTRSARREHYANISNDPRELALSLQEAERADVICLNDGIAGGEVNPDVQRMVAEYVDHVYKSLVSSESRCSRLPDCCCR